MAKIFIDDQEYEVDSQENLLHVVLSLGLNLPYFCWHPALGSVGACRQCAVVQFRDENDKKGRLVMACMTPISDGLRISLQNPAAVGFRSSVTEWLMLNHPHDCPICDEGGECHLQDMTVMTGHNYRRKRFNKRTFKNQYLGPFINHEMNRCIECYRCVRFYRDFAGGRDFDVFAAHDHVYFGRQEEGVLENEFSGNLVEICPTGVFTDKTLKKHYTRKWDLQTAPSICVHCSLGCNTIPGERYGSLRRIRNRFNSDVNGYFLCDRGRYGYEFVNSTERVRQPQLKTPQSSDPEPATVEEAISYLHKNLGPGTSLIGIGSPRATLESNFALRSLVGEKYFFAGISADQSRLHQRVVSILRDGPVPTASLQEVAAADAVLVLGEDVTNTAPMLALSLRQAVRNQPNALAQKRNIALWNDAAIREIVQEHKGPLYIATPAATRLDDVATSTVHLAPDDIARFGFAVAHAIDSSASAVDDLPDELKSLADEIANTLKDAQNPLVVSGTSLGNEAVLQAVANVAWALKAVGKDPRITFALPESNSMGLALLEEKSLEQALQVIKNDSNVTLIVLENDLYTRSDTQTVNELLDTVEQIIVLDSFDTATSARADLVLPAATFAEGDGTLVNNEGRAQRYFQVLDPQEDIRESWRWIGEMMDVLKHELAGQWATLDDVIRTLADFDPLFAPVQEVAPLSNFRILDEKVPRQPHRYSGRTSMRADINVSEPKPPEDPDSPLAFSMEGYKGQPPSALIPRYWSPGWNSVQSLNKFQEEVGGLLKGGNPGRRLIGAADKTEPAYFDEIPTVFDPHPDEFLTIPLYHIFGSDPLSRMSPAVLERSPAPYLALSGKDAEKLGVDDAQKAQIELDGTSLSLPVRLLGSLPVGTVGLPVGLPTIPAALPVWSKLGVEGTQA
ncbi:MAG: NADH-quinone oxidoreductase subunit NuoG [Anaerolineales bacterium]